MIFFLLVEELSISFDRFLMFGCRLLFSIGNEGFPMPSHPWGRILMGCISPVFEGYVASRVHNLGYCRVVNGRISPIILNVIGCLLLLGDFRERIPESQLIEKAFLLFIFLVELRLVDAIFGLIVCIKTVIASHS